MGVIRLDSMAFFAYHGCFEEERKVGNDFLVDLEIKTNTEKPECSDNIQDALNYQEVYWVVEKEMAEPNNLLERVAKRIMSALFAKYPSQILHLKVTVKKMNPPLGGKLEYVSVTLEE